MMLCVDFEDRLTDYLEGALASEAQRACAEHVLRCPVCHDLLSEVRATVTACQNSLVPVEPSAGFEAQVIQRTAPETAMTCEEFEEHLTDYLDGFLPAALYHRWERHAALCSNCTELPGAVVRSIGACYTALSQELPMPIELHARILEETIGTANAREVRASFSSRLFEYLRGLIDAAVTPQFATVATMLLVAVLVGTTTISDDGSIGGMYRAGLRLAAQTYVRGATSAAQSVALPAGVRRVAGEWAEVVAESTESGGMKEDRQRQSDEWDANKDDAASGNKQ
jgi:anti-sigma factor RsiW